MNQAMVQLREFFLQYSLKQRLIIGAIVIGFLSAIISLLLWANRTEYEMLYSGLEPNAASSIVSDLRNSKIKYRLENGGTTIYVPRESVPELRLKYIQSGYIKDAITGYEIFEKNNLGMTTFMQQLNMKRALEGELMRTINQFDEVKMSRVHLVMPENRLFEEENTGSASVVLHLVPGAVLNTNQVNGIAALVANSVEGIEAKDVVVMDSNGNILVEGAEEDGSMGMVNNQYQLKQALEDELEKKVTAIVEGVVGKKNTVVRVSTDLNFDQIERTVEEVDPDKTVLVSEEKYTETSQSNLDSSNFVAEKVTSNYELTKKVERFVSNVGGINRLTVAVLVNGKYTYTEDENGEKKAEYVPRSEEELAQIEALVKSAVGFDEERGDIVEVQNLQFTSTKLEEDKQFFQDEMQHEFWMQIITYALLAIGLLLGFFLLKGLLKNSVEQLKLPGLVPAAALAGGGQATGALPDGTVPELPQVPAEPEIPEDMYMRKLSPEARAKMRASDKMTSEVIRFAENNPEDTSKLLRSWITQAGLQKGDDQ